MLESMRCKILQDTAAILVLHGENRRSHPLWRYDVFNTVAFQEFQCTMKSHLEQAVDPSQNTLQHVAPPLSHLMLNIQSSVNMMGIGLRAACGSPDKRLIPIAQQQAAFVQAADFLVQQSRGHMAFDQCAQPRQTTPISAGQGRESNMDSVQPVPLISSYCARVKILY